jgi:CRP-like cAMP-binding protein
MNPFRKLLRYLDGQREEIAKTRLDVRIAEVIAENNHRERIRRGIETERTMPLPLRRPDIEETVALDREEIARLVAAIEAERRMPLPTRNQETRR